MVQLLTGQYDDQLENCNFFLWTVPGTTNITDSNQQQQRLNP